MIDTARDLREQTREELERLLDESGRVPTAGRGPDMEVEFGPSQRSREQDTADDAGSWETSYKKSMDIPSKEVITGFPWFGISSANTSGTYGSSIFVTKKDDPSNCILSPPESSDLFAPEHSHSHTLTNYGWDCDQRVYDAFTPIITDGFK